MIIYEDYLLEQIYVSLIFLNIYPPNNFLYN